MLGITVESTTDRQKVARAERWLPEAPRRWLMHSRLPLTLALLVSLIALPSLWGGWVADDHHHRLRLTTDANFLNPVGSLGSRLDLFRFAVGDEQQTQRLMDLGIWPWWTLPNLQASFWRPITSVTHWLDYQLWPNHSWPMHAHSIAWFAVLVWAATMLYRRMLGLTLVAGLAALLYAIDDARAMPVGFLANRNALVAGFFGIFAIMAHDRWRRCCWRPGAVVAPALLGVSLLSAEAGIGAAGYLIAHALFLEKGNRYRRVLSLVPHGVVVLAWRAVWSHLGYGIWGIGIYVDPLVEPIQFLVGLFEKIPLLLLGQFLFPPSEFYLLCTDLGINRYYFPFAAALVVVVVFAIFRRIRWNATNRFWAAGMLLSLIPACSAFPADRMLIFAGLGAFALLAEFLRALPIPASRTAGFSLRGFSPLKGLRTLFDSAHENENRAGSISALREGKENGVARFKRFAGRAFLIALLLVHVVIAPVMLALRSVYPVGPSGFLARVQITTPFDDSIERQSLVIVNALVPVLASWYPERCVLEGWPLPAHTRVLAPAFPGPTKVSRSDEYTLVIRPGSGFLKHTTDQICRGLRHPLALGERVVLSDMTAEVLALTDDGRPAEVAFRFTVPLENASLHWLRWGRRKYVPFVPPAVGETVLLRR